MRRGAHGDLRFRSTPPARRAGIGGLIFCPKTWLLSIMIEKEPIDRSQDFRGQPEAAKSGAMNTGGKDESGTDSDV